MTALPLTQLQAQLKQLRFASRATHRMKSFHYGLLHDAIMFTQVLSPAQLDVVKGCMEKVDDKASDASLQEMRYILSSAGLSITPRID